MKRKDLFRKALSKVLDVAAEAGEEVVQSFRSHDANQVDSRPLKAQNAANSIDSHEFNEKVSHHLAKNKDQNTKSKEFFKNKQRTFQPINLKRPPGAVQPESKFKKLCTGCSECTYSCPYGVIFPIYDDNSNKNLPFIDVNANACMLCEDTPCIESCPTGALKPHNNGIFLPLGQAKGLFNHCINHQTGEKTCTACQESCPIDKTVKFKANRPSFAKSCVGCGLCVKSCPTYPKAIRVY